ncbi:MAG: glycosyltransferase family 4 protein [Thermoplasmata archaeon]|nr:glycosyltransferase family 4 protein [Thermoplasmata archaeon]
MTIKVVLVTHLAANSVRGGAETQILKTMDYVNRLEGTIEAKLFDMWNDRIEDYDIVHIFNPEFFPTESLVISDYAKLNNVSVVTSPITYDSQGYARDRLGTVGLGFWKALVSFRRLSSKSNHLQFLDPFRNMRKILKNSDKILPNTKDEQKRMMEIFPEIPENKFTLVPNGVDLRFKNGTSKVFKDEYGIESFVLYIGAIGRRKNVHRLIEAFLRTELDTNLVIIGRIAEREYYDMCKKEADGRVVFLPPISHESELLQSAFKACKVAVLPSYYETPGLAALEGGLAGANVVVTGIGGTREYFKDYAWYVDPTSTESIKEALLEAYAAPKTSDLSNHIETNFTWEKVARKTADSYESLAIDRRLK